MLNRQQSAAVHHTEGPLLVLAGAGSGKTRVITHKIAYLERECDVSPENIYAVTFTNKAAREMKARLEPMLGAEAARRVNVSTFHRLGMDILRREAEAVGLKPSFTLVDVHDAVLAVREVMRAELAADPELIEQVQRRISSWKNLGIGADDLDRVAVEDPIAQAAVRVYPEYERRLRACHSVDLDDLILIPATLLARNRAVRRRWRRRVRHLLVDEYQDTNGAQFALLRELVGRDGGLTVVGDDDQSIYAWRGARPENLAALREEFPKLAVIKLEQNYRSCRRVLKVANALIANNARQFEKTLWSELGHGEPVDVMTARNDEHEAEKVITHLMHHRFQTRGAYGDYAVLYRGNHQSRILEQKLREMRIPYVLSGEQSFFDRAEIKDIQAYLRLLVNPDDDRAFLRAVNTPRRGIGPGALERLAGHAAQVDASLFAAMCMPDAAAAMSSRQHAALRHFVDMMEAYRKEIDAQAPAEFVQRLVTELHYESWLLETERNEDAAARRWTSVLELIDWLRRLARTDPGRDFFDMVASMTLMEIIDREDESKALDAVSLMTLHAAKGLEFPFVYIVGVEEDILPHRASIDAGTVDEERRLFYVGITRARQRLALSWARQRKRFGEIIDTQPSRFLDELPAVDLNWLDDEHRDQDKSHATGQAYLANIRELLG